MKQKSTITPLSALVLRSQQKPEAPALIAGDEVWNCKQLANGIDCLARSLWERGVRRGERVALHMLNIPELVIAYCACFRIGALAVPLNARYKTEEIAAMIQRIRPALYLGQAELYKNAAQVDTGILPLEARYITHLDKATDGIRLWSELIRETISPGKQLVETDDLDAPAVLLATSGTTGPSKLVVWTQSTLACLTDSALGRGITERDRVLISTPMMHGSGVYYMASCLLQGALMVLLPQFDANEFLDAIEKHGCTTMFGLPFMCAEVGRRQTEKPRNLESLRLCTVAGDVCPAEVEASFQEATGLPLLSFWAAAEDVGAMTLGSGVGPFMHPVAGVELRIVDDADQTVRFGETGELLLRSSTTSPGYWNGPNEVDPLPNGWFHSGDLVRAEENGDLRYMGRKKDLIVRGGSNISPIEVESVMRTHPAVRDAAIAGIGDQELGQRVGAAVVLVQGQQESVLPEILMFVRQRLADYKVPERIVLVESIPRNTLSKVDRKSVADRINHGK